MLPDGAVHIPREDIPTETYVTPIDTMPTFADKGCAKVARKLGISFAEAVVSLTFFSTLIPRCPCFLGL